MVRELWTFTKDMTFCPINQINYEIYHLKLDCSIEQIFIFMFYWPFFGLKLNHTRSNFLYIENQCFLRQISNKIIQKKILIKFFTLSDVFFQPPTVHLILSIVKIFIEVKVFIVNHINLTIFCVPFVKKLNSEHFKRIWSICRIETQFML